MWNYASDRLSVGIRSPTGEVISRVPAKAQSTFETRLILEKASIFIEYEYPMRGSGSQNTVIKILNATP
jgi:hypothetical protein